MIPKQRDRATRELMEFINANPDVTARELTDRAKEIVAREDALPTRKQRIIGDLKLLGYWIGMFLLVWGVIMTGIPIAFVWVVKHSPPWVELWVGRAFAAFWFYALLTVGQVLILAPLYWALGWTFDSKHPPRYFWFTGAVLTASVMYWYWPEIR
jgi:hypothetical protein